MRLTTAGNACSGIDVWEVGFPWCPVDSVTISVLASVQPGWFIINSQPNLRFLFFLKWSWGSISSLLSLLIAWQIVYNTCFCSPLLSFLLYRTVCVLQYLCSTHWFPIVPVSCMDAWMYRLASCSHWCPSSPSCVLQTQLSCCELLPHCITLFCVSKVWPLTWSVS